MGALAVAFGAFGAHALNATLEANGRLETYETAVRYQFYHTLVLIVLALAYKQFKNKKLINWAAWSFFAGTVVFSGTLYILCLTGITILGAITPIGGVLLMIGWVLLAISARGLKK